MVIIVALAAAVVVALFAGYLVGERVGRRSADDGVLAGLDPAPHPAQPADPGGGEDPVAVDKVDEPATPEAFHAGRPAVVVLPRPEPEPPAADALDEVDAEAPPSGEAEDAALPGAEEVATLWDLELARVEREWRIATVPLDVPFLDAEGPGGRLRAALQMELERHREQSGGDASVEGAAADGLSPSVALAALRLTQETVAELGRLSDRVTVELGGDEVTARVTVKARGADVPPGFADWLATAADGLGADSKVTRGPEAVVEITVPAAGELDAAEDPGEVTEEVSDPAGEDAGPDEDAPEADDD